MFYWLTLAFCSILSLTMRGEYVYVETALTKLPRVKNITSMQFNKLFVLGFAGVTATRAAIWTCLCECGKIVNVPASNLRRQISCGCEARKNAIKASTTHGMSKTSEFNIWSGMRKRTRSINDKYYPRYGAKGIGMSDEWFDSFEQFYEDMGPRPKGCSIDRVDNSKGYSKENCRWASFNQQNRNKSSNHLWTLRGETKCISEWADLLGIRKDTLRRRVCVYGWTVEKALTTGTRGKQNALL